MPKFNDQTYLKNDQYRDSNNLDARVSLHQRFSTNPQGWFSWVFDTLERLPTRARVLELGCGKGHLWRTCANRIPKDWSITLSDLSEGMLLSAWRNLVVTGRALKYEQIDAQSIPYPDETFEIVLANHMLYHVPDRPKAIREIRRVLKPGGWLVAATGGENHMKEMTGWFQQINADMDFSAAGNSFTLENGMEQLKPFFEQVEILRYHDSLRITEVPALMNYVRSSIRAGGLPETALKKLEYDLEQELSLKGEILVTEDAGLFLAIK
jgi:ubiquinone/menaquinone biosynthesis C-methylase UbiE